jgi:hypothetical protein
METRYAPLVFKDGSGAAAGNAEWILEPDLSAVVGQPARYWDITGDVVSLMDQAARDAVDAQLLSDRRDNTADLLDGVENINRAFALVVLDEINTLRAQHSLPDRTIAQLKTALRNKLGT